MIRLTMTFLFGNKQHGKHIIKSNELLNYSNTLAQFIMLKQEYKLKDESRKVPLDVRVYLNFRNKLIKKIKKANKGKLTCEYCGERNLDPNFRNLSSKRKKATLDHFIPLSKGGSKFNTDNIKISCDSCNQKKKDTDPKLFLNLKNH